MKGTTQEKKYFYCTAISLVDELEGAGFPVAAEREGRFFPGQRVWLFEVTPELQRVAKAHYDRKGKPYPRSLFLQADTESKVVPPGGDQDSVSDQRGNGTRGLFCSKKPLNEDFSLETETPGAGVI